MHACVEAALLQKNITTITPGSTLCIIGIIYQGNHKESPGKEVEVVRACNEKRGTHRRKEGDEHESTRKRGIPNRR